MPRPRKVRGEAETLTYRQCRGVLASVIGALVLGGLKNDARVSLEGVLALTGGTTPSQEPVTPVVSWVMGGLYGGLSEMADRTDVQSAFQWWLEHWDENVAELETLNTNPEVINKMITELFKDTPQTHDAIQRIKNLALDRWGDKEKKPE